MKVGVAGLGLVSKLGDTGNVKQLLMENRRIDPGKLPAGHTLDLSKLNEYNLSQSLLRRVNHFAKIALLSACNAVRDFGRDLAGKSVGIIQASVYGPIVSGIQAFDDLIDFGDNQLSPTNFSGSVFNTSATYLSLAFGIQGPLLAHTAGLDTLYTSLLTASLWLENGTVDFAVVGIGDEYTAYFDRETPDCRPTGLLPTCEGWTTFILSKESKPKYGRIEYGHRQTLPETANCKNIYSVWHGRSSLDAFSHHARDNQACFPVGLRGSYPSAAAFDLALALICAQTGRFPAGKAVGENYRIVNLEPGERVNCYCTTENRGIVRYKIVTD
jgi:3-oxoacyl-[acyl-carrier-protein] synthase II